MMNKEGEATKTSIKSKGIVERLDIMENQIAKLNEEVREIKTIISNMKEHDSMLVHK